MRDRLRRFAVVGLIATVVDVGLLVLLLGWGWPLVAADVAALAVAALVPRNIGPVRADQLGAAGRCP